MNSRCRTCKHHRIMKTIATTNDAGEQIERYESQCRRSAPTTDKWGNARWPKLETIDEGSGCAEHACGHDPAMVKQIFVAGKPTIYVCLCGTVLK